MLFRNSLRALHKPFFLGLAAASLWAGMPAHSQAKDYIVTLARPNHLFLIDAAARKVVNTCKLDGFFAPAVVVMSPDNKIAYVLKDRWENIFGINVDTCEIVFSAVPSTDEERVKIMGSLAVSKDGKELYTVHNSVRIMADRYQVLEPRLVVYDTSAGMNAKPVRTFPAPRRLTVMATDKKGTLYVAGHDIYAVDPKTGKFEVAIANRNWNRPTYSPPDVLAFWPIGSQSNEFLLMYTAAVFTNEKMEEIKDFVWGASRIDTNTGERTIADFASLEVLMFSAVTNPNNANELFGVYTQLSKHDLKAKKLIKRVELPHTYYCINVSSDGKEIYVGGTMRDIGVYDSETLERIGEIKIPTNGDMGTATVQVFSR